MGKTMNFHSIRITAPLSALVILASVATQCARADDALWRALKEGGKVVLMRHAPFERLVDRHDQWPVLWRQPHQRPEQNLPTAQPRPARPIEYPVVTLETPLRWCD
jgi:hypothetical protein